MRHILIFSLMLACFTVHAQGKYDKALADSLGADDYGMKMYVLVILKTGSIAVDKKTSDSLFAGHMKNMGRMVDAGKLIVAGPLQKNDNNYRGIFIFNVRTIEEAKALLDTDPAVKAKVLDAELYGWYGSAALPMYLPEVPKVQKKSF
ncbi:MAG TPA: YciI family protein [Chitinophagaceae bacterium]|nr:YciI family protein [Chitinophagaceae bacterium]